MAESARNGCLSWRRGCAGAAYHRWSVPGAPSNGRNLRVSCRLPLPGGVGCLHAIAIAAPTVGPRRVVGVRSGQPQVMFRSGPESFPVVRSAKSAREAAPVFRARGINMPHRIGPRHFMQEGFFVHRYGVRRDTVVLTVVAVVDQ